MQCNFTLLMRYADKDHDGGACSVVVDLAPSASVASSSLLQLRSPLAFHLSTSSFSHSAPCFSGSSLSYNKFTDINHYSSSSEKLKIR